MAEDKVKLRRTEKSRFLSDSASTQASIVEAFEFENLSKAIDVYSLGKLAYDLINKPSAAIKA